ncbi:MAG: hypothetical protein A4E53_01867 [Pelotomaculum sp. PtaB.Bin104]|nr:MAG: hypothetical protein A4E53_01867 [Pelotomaculum sp. PtaB.Bin104]
MNQNAEKKTIIINRIFDIPVELVWNAWTDPKLVMEWWGPINFTSPRCKIDFREGGKYLFCMRAPAEMGGQESYSTGTYTKIIPMEHLEFTHSISDKDGNIIDPSLIGLPDFPKEIEFVVEFKARGNQTELIIKEEGWKVGQMAELAELA